MKKMLSRRFPFLRAVKRYWNACADARLRPRQSYSQFGEDVILARLIGKEEREAGIYVDIGGNHPTRLSNTYRFYREGGDGLIVEPNYRFRTLFRIFRPRDRFVPVGCGERTEVREFFHHPTTVLSGFSSQSAADASAVEYLPVFRLDELKHLVRERRVYLLSIDVEGMDYEVLLGGRDFIAAKVDRVVIEFGSKEGVIGELLDSIGFSLAERTSHNAIYSRRDSGK